MAADPRANTVDLFCGAGGLSAGLESTGFSAALGCDFWKPAAETFRANFPSTPFLQADARELGASDLLAASGSTQAPTLVVGGPPCQGFSSAGARREGDERNTLVGTFARLVAELRPQAFIFENVEGFLTAAGGAYVRALLDPTLEAGYAVRIKKVNVANFGVPQLRKRVVAVGALGSAPSLPTPTHRAWGAPGVHIAGGPALPLTPSLGEALDGLPLAASTPPGKPTDHFRRRIGPDDEVRIKALAPGQTMRDLPSHLQHASYQRRANRRVRDGTPTERRGGAPAGLRRLIATEPSKAITGAATREFIHPLEDRPLTLRECARLQTFDDAFLLCGSQADRAVLVGNAVPPLFASVVAEALRDRLENVPPAGRSGRLVSFEPTVSEGMSPALAKVTRGVVQRYQPGPELSLWQEGESECL